MVDVAEETDEDEAFFKLVDVAGTLVVLDNGVISAMLAFREDVLFGFLTPV